MPATDTIHEPAIDQRQAREALGDVNRRREEQWHLEHPHRKALAALAYTSLLRGIWAMLRPHRDSNRRVSKKEMASL
jgi:hypothetical protein